MEVLLHEQAPERLACRRCELERIDLIGPEPVDRLRLVVARCRDPGAYARLENGDDPAGLVAVLVGDPVFRPAVNPRDPYRLHGDSGFLEALPLHRFRRPLARIHGATGQLPAPLAVPHEQDAPVAVADQGSDSGYEHEAVAELLTQPASVIGHRHG